MPEKLADSGRYPSWCAGDSGRFAGGTSLVGGHRDLGLGLGRPFLRRMRLFLRKKAAVLRIRAVGGGGGGMSGTADETLILKGWSAEQRAERTRTSPTGLRPAAQGCRAPRALPLDVERPRCRWAANPAGVPSGGGAGTGRQSGRDPGGVRGGKWMGRRGSQARPLRVHAWAASRNRVAVRFCGGNGDAPQALEPRMARSAQSRKGSRQGAKALRKPEML